ncbi:MAG: PTS fructose transporter subunit IIA [Gammaproteobacteria bacterium]|nr:PTS fructose transporter subunit IIA [Gammaproteobacteria bacterium]
MSVGLLIITHAPFGKAALEAACGTLGSLALSTRVIDIHSSCNLEQEREHAKTLLHELDEGDGVLLLTDLYGATPSNIACSLMGGGQKRVLVSGLNLAMLIRVMNYADEKLPALAERAINGGHGGIHRYPPLAQEEPLNHA